MFQCSVIQYSIGKTLIIQSEELKEGTPLFLLKIQEDLSFFSYHCGVKCTISTLSTNRIRRLDKWSRVAEAIRFLNTKVIGHKVEILLEQVKSMNSLTYVGEKKYSAETIARAFEYFAVSRSLYRRLREDYELPSISTLTKITSKVSSLQDCE